MCYCSLMLKNSCSFSCSLRAFSMRIILSIGETLECLRAILIFCKGPSQHGIGAGSRSTTMLSEWLSQDLSFNPMQTARESLLLSSCFSGSLTSVISTLNSKKATKIVRSFLGDQGFLHQELLPATVRDRNPNFFKEYEIFLLVV